ncbi:unnamed protein product [Symbiodinium pilosum]|uniref:Uncharacterized protein n=1 Tax=Symbiodinium pilosum TaxID=2952 RepID=A0A812LXI5_SYMPI|nr:unnamed protein product [Symbiodinium pilosum]
MRSPSLVACTSSTAPAWRTGCKHSARSMSLQRRGKGSRHLHSTNICTSRSSRTRLYRMQQTLQPCARTPTVYSPHRATALYQNLNFSHRS